MQGRTNTGWEKIIAAASEVAPKGQAQEVVKVPLIERLLPKILPSRRVMAPMLVPQIKTESPEMPAVILPNSSKGRWKALANSLKMFLMSFFGAWLLLMFLPLGVDAALPPPIQHNAWTTNVSPNDRISGDATTPGGSSLALTLKNTGTAGQYTKTTFDAQGRETSGTTLSASDIPDLSGTYILSLAGSGTNTTIKSNLTVNVSSKDSFILHGTSGGPGLAFDFQQSLVRASNSVTLDTIWFNNGLQLGNTFGAPTIQLATDIGRVTATSFSGDGSLLTALNASQNTSGTLPAGRLPALTGAITTSAGSATTSLGSFSSANLVTALTDETGSGSAVFGTAPTITGGSITALTTFGLRDTSAAFDLTLAAVSGAALTAGRTLTLDMGNAAHTLVLGSASTLTFPTGTKTIPATADNLSVFAATTSAQLRGVLSDESGTGAALFGGGVDASDIASGTLAIARGGTAAGTAVGALDSLITAEANVASATTTDLGAATTRNVNITGTTTITGFGTVAAGVMRWGRFAGALTLTHNATSLILPGAANITTAANDRFSAVSLGSGNWLVYMYQKADGTAVVSSGGGNFSTNASTADATLYHDLTVANNINSTGGQFNGNGAGLTNVGAHATLFNPGTYSFGTASYLTNFSVSETAGAFAVNAGMGIITNTATMRVKVTANVSFSAGTSGSTIWNLQLETNGVACTTVQCGGYTGSVAGDGGTLVGYVDLPANCWNRLKGTMTTGMTLGPATNMKMEIQ